MTEIIAMTVGVGSGSKYIHMLLDGNQGLYSLPGYPLMYYYQHFDEVDKKYQRSSSLEAKVYEIISRLPSIYDATVMPGSESLDKIRDNEGNQIRVDITTYAREVIANYTLDFLNSKELIIAIHKAHKIIFSKQICQAWSRKLLIHIHDDNMLKRITIDFPQAKILSTYRKPSINLERRIRSSYLEANKTKLTDIDYEILSWSSPEKYSFLHYICLNTYKALNNEIYIVNYDCFLQNEYNAYKSMCQHLSIIPEKEKDLKKTYLGQEHKLYFYERNRGKSIEDIRKNSLGEVVAKMYKIDKIYLSIITSEKMSNIDKIKSMIEIFRLTNYEKELIGRLLKGSIRKEMDRCLNKCYLKQLDEYNNLHGFYIFKWSTPKKFIAIRNLIIKVAIKNKLYGKKVCIIFYQAIKLLAPIIIMVSILKRMYYQLMTLRLVEAGKNANSGVHFIS